MRLIILSCRFRRFLPVVILVAATVALTSCCFPGHLCHALGATDILLMFAWCGTGYGIVENAAISSHVPSVQPELIGCPKLRVYPID